MLNEEAGLGVQGRVVEEVEAEDEHLVRLAEELRGSRVEKAEGAEHLQAELLQHHVRLEDGTRVAQDVAAASKQQREDHLQTSLFHKSEVGKRDRAKLSQVNTGQKMFLLTA